MFLIQIIFLFIYLCMFLITFQDLCEYLFCSKSTTVRGAHPALQGSRCGVDKICIAGSCKPESELKRLIILFFDIFRKLEDYKECGNLFTGNFNFFVK